MNVLNYGAKFYNVTFENNRGSAVRVSFYKFVTSNSNQLLLMSVNLMLNKNSLAVKKCEANQKQHCSYI